MYKYAALDPRRGPASEEANDAVFASGPVIGIEVTVPALAKRCAVNLDPQHSGGNAERAAIEEALKAALPPEGATLATIRADLDSVGSMAVFSLRAKGENLKPAINRVACVAASDKFANGEWASRPLPTTAEPWQMEESYLAAIAAAVMDFKVPLARRVAWMSLWLLTGINPDGYQARVEDERSAFISALNSGEIAHWLDADDRIAVVKTSHRAATTVGYALAPVVVALNPAFRLGGGEPHRKFTVCQFSTGFVDLPKVLAALAELEDGWGGSPTIGGSPQGVSSTLTTDQVVAVVERHLR